MKQISICMAVMAVVLFSCNAAKDKKDTTKENPQLAAKHLDAVADQNKNKAGLSNLAQQVEEKAPAPQREPPNENWDKKIIKNAEVSLELKEYAKYNQSIHAALKSYGAYIANEEQLSDNAKQMNSLMIKVPVAQFQNLMNSFSGDGIKVLQKKISSDDVTGEVIDTRSRLEAKKQTRQRYLDLLKQAKNMKEILEVQTELNSIQEEIESAAGRVSYLNHESAYSTIHLSYFQLIAGTKSPEETNSYFFRLKESFRTGVTVIGGFFIFFVSIWPVILIGTIAFFVWKKKKPVHTYTQKRN
jgi:hypothetical protein